MSEQTAALIAERRQTHGNWPETAQVAQKLKALAAREGRVPLTPAQREALDMILTKVARIVCGDPGHRDHWDDIAGYAALGREGQP